MSTSTLVHDRQQEKALSLLRRAQGAEVSYDELREAGIQYPASTVSELELSGVPVERGRWVNEVCWRLDPAPARVAPPVTEPEAPSVVEDAPVWAPVRVYRPRLVDRLPRLPAVSPTRALTGVALLAAAVTVAVLVISSFGSGSRARRVVVVVRHVRAPVARSHRGARSHQSAVHRHASHPATGSHPAPASSTSTSPTPSGSPTALEANGHDLLQSGQYSSAIPVLKQAVKATGEHPGACTDPATQNCLTYAFALYDLGRALRLDGDPSAAVPILKTRLAINNQRSTVAQELQLAESGASG